MKITKSELKEMIREALREELNTRATLKESLWVCFFDDREVGTVAAATEEEAKEKMMDKYPEYPYSLYDGCFYVEPADDEYMNKSWTKFEPKHYKNTDGLARPSR
jgi:hypothetical protein